jgi:hypothetical protein
MGFDLTRMVLEREEMKREQVSTTRAVWQARCALVKAWKSEEGVKGPDMGLDEALLHDKERVAKKAKVEAMGFVAPPCYLGPVTDMLSRAVVLSRPLDGLRVYLQWR